jgi:hypothetical protein
VNVKVLQAVVVKTGGSEAGRWAGAFVVIVGALLAFKAVEAIAHAIVTVLTVLFVCLLAGAALFGWLWWRRQQTPDGVRRDGALVMEVRPLTPKDGLAMCGPCQEEYGLVHMATHVQLVNGKEVRRLCWQRVQDPNFNPIRRPIEGTPR